ncbi:unnamed protein product [Callosobruchus maculatus]|uniref:Uncharacterized protein n=1 Tax=Callosobruchus maculatus TaxID=64391 RepID=A0A653BRH6_CALMS|nr:unnamed protein product [Callosobruchus maculatus]
MQIIIFEIPLEYIPRLASIFNCPLCAMEIPMALPLLMKLIIPSLTVTGVVSCGVIFFRAESSTPDFLDLKQDKCKSKHNGKSLTEHRKQHRFKQSAPSATTTLLLRWDSVFKDTLYVPLVLIVLTGALSAEAVNQKPAHFSWRVYLQLFLSLARKEHEAICEFAPLLCPLRLLDCFWEGDKDDLVDHLKSRHPERIIFSNTENFVCRSVLGGTCLLMVVLFHTEDTLFRAYWQFDRQEALMKFSICQIDRSKKEEEFYYSISLLDIHTEKETLKLTTKCYISNEVQQEKMENTDFVAFEYDILRKATTEFGDVKCKKRCLVKIIFFFFITITTPKKWKLLYRECTQSFRKLNKNFISQKPEF